MTIPDEMENRATLLAQVARERWLKAVDEMLTVCEQHQLPPAALLRVVRIVEEFREGTLCVETQQLLDMWWRGHTTLCGLSDLLVLSPNYPRGQ